VPARCPWGGTEENLCSGSARAQALGSRFGPGLRTTRAAQGPPAPSRIGAVDQPTAVSADTRKTTTTSSDQHSTEQAGLDPKLSGERKKGKSRVVTLPRGVTGQRVLSLVQSHDPLLLSEPAATVTVVQSKSRWGSCPEGAHNTRPEVHATKR